MRKLYPECLADSSFDNTGLLLEAPHSPQIRKSNSILLTIDLTTAVADEAIENNHSVVVAYHPIIFRGLRSLTLDDSQSRTLLRLASEGISVYCPHTAVDAVPGGMADWLCDIVAGKLDDPEPEAHTAQVEMGANGESEVVDDSGGEGSATDVTTSAEGSGASSPVRVGGDEDDDPFTSTPQVQRQQRQQQSSTAKPNHNHQKKHESTSSQAHDTPTASGKHRTYSKPSMPSIHHPRHPHHSNHQHTLTTHPSALDHSRLVLHPSPTPSLHLANNINPSNHPTDPTYSPETTGAGRFLTFTDPQPLSLLISRIAHGLGSPKGFPVAIPQMTSIEDHNSIRSVAICPGSGAGVFFKPSSALGEDGSGGVEADLYFTGELSHHDALRLIERGACVVTVGHSNSERGYLWSVMQEQLRVEVGRVWGEIKRGEKGEDGEKDGVVKSVEKEGNDDDGAEEEDEDEVTVEVSERDRDPFGIVVLDG